MDLNGHALVDDQLAPQNYSADPSPFERLLESANVRDRIFSFLSVPERIQLEMANKKLQSLMLGCWSQQTAFDVASTIPLCDSRRKRREAVLAICCGRIGVGLRLLKLSRRAGVELDWSADLRAIGEACPNVESINFRVEKPISLYKTYHHMFCERGSFVVPFDLRFDCFANLRSLSFVHTRFKSYDDEDFVEAAMATFLTIPTRIESIVGLGLKDEFQTAAELEGFFAARPSLREVCMRHLHIRPTKKPNFSPKESGDDAADFFRVIAERCPHLKKIDLDNCDIDVHGVVALSSMRELCLKRCTLSDSEVVTICERSPLLDVLMFSYLGGGLAGLYAIGSLTKLREVFVSSIFCGSSDVDGYDYKDDYDPITVEGMTCFVRLLVRNSGATLQRLELNALSGQLPAMAIKALVSRCAKLRRLRLSDRYISTFVEDAAPSVVPSSSPEQLPVESSFANVELIERLLANVDVWERIFGFLDVKERIQVEMSSKRLHSLMRACWSRQTSFDITSVVPLSPRLRKRAAAVVAICSHRMGVGLRHLKLSRRAGVVLECSADLCAIGEACPNVESIDFRVEKPNCDYGGSFVAPFNLRFDCFANLRSLSFMHSSCRPYNPNEFVAAAVATFLTIPTRIESIVGLYLTDGFETAAELEGFFAARPSLREVRMRNLHIRWTEKPNFSPEESGDDAADVFRVIAERCPHLKKIDLDNYDIDVHGVVALSSMRELCLKRCTLSDSEVVTICERSPLLEVLMFRGLVGGMAALYAIGSLTKLREVFVYDITCGSAGVEGCDDEDDYGPITAEGMTCFVRLLVRNSGATLQRLELNAFHGQCLEFDAFCRQLPTMAIKALVSRCAKLRRFRLGYSDIPLSVEDAARSVVPSSSPDQQLLVESSFASAELIERLLANVDVWERIFGFLDIDERIQVERSSRRLHSLMLACWGRQRSFDIKSVVPFSTSMRKRAAAVVAICSSRIGVGLRRLKLSRRCGVELDWTADLRVIGEACPNVHSIDFHIKIPRPSGANVDVAPPTLRFDAFKSLRDLSFSGDSRGDGFVGAPAAVFLSIPHSIERIVGLCLKTTGVEKKGGWVCEDAFESAGQLESFFANRPSLKEIRVRSLRTNGEGKLGYHYDYGEDDSKANIFLFIAKRCPQLKTIELCGRENLNMRGVVALSSMRELRFPDVYFDDNEIEAICVHSPLLEILVLSGISGARALTAISTLTNLRELETGYLSCEVDEWSLTDFFRELGSNSGGSLRRLDTSDTHFSTATIEVLANGCTKLRDVRFKIQATQATPASIRYLVDCVVADPSWNPTTPDEELKIFVTVNCSRTNGDTSASEMAPYHALSEPAAHLPVGVRLSFYAW